MKYKSLVIGTTVVGDTPTDMHTESKTDCSIISNVCENIIHNRTIGCLG